jgi:ribonuclease P protein component
MTPSRPRLRLPRAMRIRASRDFGALKVQGRRLAVGCLLANWKTLPSGATSRVGVVTSRRVGSAVVRNRARRLLREAFRLHQADLAVPVEAVLVARPSIAGQPLAVVKRDYLEWLRRAALLRNP